MAFSPEKDELLSSWLARVSHAHRQKLTTFYRYASEDFRVLNIDIDANINERFLQNVSEMAGLPIEQIKNCSLYYYENRLFLRKSHRTHTNWIMMTGIKSKKKQRALMYCPSCLQKDGKNPYYRKQWRLALSVCCPTCSLWLSDRCPECESPVIFLRNDLGRRIILPSGTLAHCFNCGFDLRKTPYLIADPFMVKKQAMLQKYIEDGYTETLNYSHLYFEGLYQIVRVLNSETIKSLSLRAALSRRTGINFSYQKDRKYEVFEQKDLLSRIPLLRMAFEMMDCWPYKFVEICQGSKIWTDTLYYATRNREKLPFWYWDIVNYELKIKIWNKKNPTRDK